MDEKSGEMVGLLKDSQTALVPYESVMKDPAFAGQSHPDRTLSNFDLLCKTLSDFYSKDSRASYLPRSISQELQSELINLKGNLSQTPHDKLTAVAAQGILASLDKCYAISLKYGLITFGFDQRNIQTLVTSANGMHAKINEIGGQVEQRVKEFDKTLNSAHDKALGIYDDLVKKVSDDLDAKITTASESIEKAKTAYQELEKKIATTDQIVASSQDQLVKVQDTASSISKTQSQLTQDYEGLKTTLTEAKTILENVKETRLGMKTQFDNITEFYAEIESHKKKIADIKKDADESFNKLTEHSTKSVADYASATNDIVNRNKQLHVEIVEHLRKAISGSLFSAFSKRSGGLNVSKWVWAAILACCVGAGIWLTLTIAHDLAGVPNKAFFVKLSAMLPILFLLGFSAKQYSNERRTEEEYAFKGAISVSLEPYRELLERISKDQSPEAAAYVKKLIEEIFDNPVKRIYPLKEIVDEAKQDESLNLNAVLGSLAANAPEQFKAIVDILKKRNEPVTEAEVKAFIRSSNRHSCPNAPLAWFDNYFLNV